MIEQANRTGTDVFELDERKIREAAAARYIPPRLKSPFNGSPFCYAKFGKRDHIRQAFNDGILRIAPASSYDGPSLKPAQADNELEHSTVTPDEHLWFECHGLDTECKEVKFAIKPNELSRYMMIPDFHVWCCGLGYAARLFHEFNAEAVLVVRARNTFDNLISKAVSRHIPLATMKHGPLHYYDEYTTQRHQLVPIFSKGISYLYQNEYRFAWSQPEGKALQPFFVELGPLHDFAEFLELA